MRKVLRCAHDLGPAFRRTDAYPRLAKRPYAGMVEAYYGQLLVRPDGTPYGTFIHFDLESRRIAADEIKFLREAVPLFMKQLE